MLNWLMGCVLDCGKCSTLKSILTNYKYSVTQFIKLSLRGQIWQKQLLIIYLV